MNRKGFAICLIFIILCNIAGLIIEDAIEVIANTPHASIRISGNVDFKTQASNEGWQGNGTEVNPYIIENYTINESYKSGIEIVSTNVYFIIKDIYLLDTSISLNEVSNGTIKDNNFERSSKGGTGLELKSCNQVDIINNTITNHRIGISIDSCTEIKAINNAVVNGSIQIRGEEIQHWNTHNISNSNSVNYKSIYYLKNQNGSIIPPGAGQIILANCSNIVIENQDLFNPTEGIIMGYSSYNWILNNTMTSIYQVYNSGIYLDHSNNNYLSNNNVSDCDYGIYLFSSNNNRILNHKITNIWTGIYIGEFSSRNVISDNNVNQCKISIHLYKTKNNSLFRNTMYEGGLVTQGNQIDYWDSHIIDDSNIINNKPLYYWINKTDDVIPLNAGQIVLVNCTNVTIINQNIFNVSYAIQIIHSSYIHITDNNISFNYRDGLYLLNSKMNEIINNYIDDNLDGIILKNSTNNEIINNVISNHNRGLKLIDSNSNNISNNILSNLWGIDQESSNGNMILNNTILYALNYGIKLDYCDDNIIRKNILGKNSYSIFINSGKNNSIIDNNISNSEYGIFLDSRNNDLLNNYISTNDIGICLQHSSINILRNNNIFNNHLGLHLDHSIGNDIISTWNYLFRANAPSPRNCYTL